MFLNVHDIHAISELYYNGKIDEQLYFDSLINLIQVGFIKLEKVDGKRTYVITDRGIAFCVNV